MNELDLLVLCGPICGSKHWSRRLKWVPSIIKEI